MISRYRLGVWRQRNRGSITDRASDFFFAIVQRVQTWYIAHPGSYRTRDSAVSIATHYGLDGPGIESRCGRDVPHLSRPAVRPTQPPIQRVPGTGVKAAGTWRWPHTQSSAGVKEGVELHLYSPAGPSWPVLGWTLPLPLPLPILLCGGCQVICVWE